MPWKKNSPKAVSRFDELVAVPGAERKILFGCPVYMLKGERYAALMQNQVVLRLAPEDAAELIARGGKIFKPFKNRSVQGRIVVPAGIVANSRSLRAWVRRAVQRVA